MRISKIFFLLVKIIEKIMQVSCVFAGQHVADYPFYVVVDVSGTFFGGTLVASDAVITAASIHKDKNHRNVYPNKIFVLKNE